MLMKILKFALVISGLAFIMSCDLIPSSSEDVTAPVITLIGNASISINESDVYTEQGATATDDVDGNITSDIVASGTVDTEIPGIYEITYNVQDAAGNSATTLTRTITVVNVQEFSRWNSGTSQWEAFAYQPPSGTKNVSVNNDGTYMLAWTDSDELYHFNTNTWDLVTGTPPANTEDIFANLSAIWLRKTDQSIWSIALDGSGTLADTGLIAPTNTIEMIPETTFHTVVLSNNTIQYYNTVWTDPAYIVPSNYVEYVGYISASNRYVRLSDGTISDVTLATGAAISQNITVPVDVRSTVYFNSEFLVLH